MSLNVIAIIVTYETNLDRLEYILGVLADQCRFVVADNSNDALHARRIATCVANHHGNYLFMGSNVGIASAQNRGITVAWNQGADAVLLLDDDSIPADDIVERLVACSESLGRAAVVGAVAVDKNGRNVSNVSHGSDPLPHCRDMMSSGTLIRREIFERVGPFDDGLFIDCVDYDWGWRAQRMGIVLYLCRATDILHQLGNGQIAFVHYSSPIRHYYQYRNILRMLTRAHTPWTWRLSQLVRLPTKLLVIFLLMPDKGRRLRFALAGIRDAIRGRNGPWPGSNAGGVRGVRAP